MGLCVARKILLEHLAEGELKPGCEIALRIDQTLTQDATGTMAYLQFESMGLDRIRSELAVSYVDHNTIQVGPENADDHAYLRSAAAKYGAIFSKPGNGICHQLHLERFGAPGKTLLGSDSHTPTAGGLGMVGIGAGGAEVAVAMGGGCYYLSAPKVILVRLKGRMRPWVGAKDIALKALEILTAKGNTGCVLEYGGPGVSTLDVPERATIANMGAECGVTATVFPSDGVTKKFLDAQGRGECWREILPDKDAEYDRVVDMDLAALEPLAAAPHAPDNIVTVSSLAGMKVDQVVIGSCTNSSYCDMKAACRLLEGQKVHPEVSFGMAPGSRQVLLMLEKEKCVATLLAAGGRLLEATCGFCIGNSFAPASNAVSLRTSNRNFKGRCGTQSAKVYLVSPEIATLAAIHGRVMDPLIAPDLECPRVRMPAKFDVDDSMFIQPSAKGTKVAVIRGPGIGQPPATSALPDKLKGVVAIKLGDNVTTDDIMPAGERLKHRSNIETYSAFVFENIDPEFAARAAKLREQGLQSIIVGGESYGQGSSREHAALCPLHLGVRAVLAKSFERIHFANLVNWGIVPLVFKRKGDYEGLQRGDSLTASDLRARVAEADEITLLNETRRTEIAARLELSPRQRQVLLAGGLLRFVSGGGK